MKERTKAINFEKADNYFIFRVFFVFPDSFSVVTGVHCYRLCFLMWFARNSNPVLCYLSKICTILLQHRSSSISIVSAPQENQLFFFESSEILLTQFNSSEVLTFLIKRLCWFWDVQLLLFAENLMGITVLLILFKNSVTSKKIPKSDF